MAVLSISVIRAENLNGVNNSHVICYLGNKHGRLARPWDSARRMEILS